MTDTEKKIAFADGIDSCVEGVSEDIYVYLEGVFMDTLDIKKCNQLAKVLNLFNINDVEIAREFRNCIDVT